MTPRAASSLFPKVDKGNRRPVTFVLPGDGRSGGVRVTVIMANMLLDRGYDVRIVCPQPGFSARRWLSAIAGNLLSSGRDASGFLHQFRGRKEDYRLLDDLDYQPDEIVIAVGTYTIPDLRRLTKPVVKVRFNHGFPAQPDAEQEQAWRGPMRTITVSNTLVPRLQELTEGSVWGVVPNGIDTDEYFVEPAIARTGIGALYSRHPNKAPEDLIAVLQETNLRWPTIPQHVFGTEPRPAGLSHVTYTQLPPVAEARAIYNRCRTWVLTSRTEGLPGVVLEAMACGCVVVSTDNDGSIEIIEHERNGLIAPRGNREAILEEVGRSFKEPELSERLLLGAAATVRQFTWSRAADRMEDFLLETSASASSEN